jgi:hypothetical protein
MHGKDTRPAAGTRRPGRLWGLLALNAALLVILGAVTFGAHAEAQLRSRGEYTMVAGNVKGASAAAVFIVDTVNQELAVVAYNPQTKQLDGVGYANLAQDAARLIRTR